jgi:hypothetical protein
VDRLSQFETAVWHFYVCFPEHNLQWTILMRSFPAYFFLILAFAVFPSGSKAQNSPFGAGLVTISGNYNYNTTTLGAVANRKTADQLYQQALADEAAGMASLNIPLLAKSLSEAQQGVQADDQSHHLAQSAYQGTNTGMNAGNYDFSQFNAMGVSDIKDMINTSSSYWPQVSAKLQSFGIGMTEDKQYITTPYGSFPMDASPDQLTQIMSQVAAHYGISSAGIQQGVQSGLATAQAISNKTLAEVQATAAGMQDGGRSLAGGKQGGGTGALGPNGDPSRNKGANGPNAGLKERASSDIDKNGIDWDAKARAVAQFREEVTQDLGYEPIWTKDDDIFQKIHLHYEALDRQNVFLGETSVVKTGVSEHFFAIGN